ncbi:MAG: RNA 2',3'-cyclic phosphodiesterase [Terracidiphilus sp.]
MPPWSAWADQQRSPRLGRGINCFGMRLFVAVPMPTEIWERLAGLSARLKKTIEGMRWSAPESWHITLQFLGNASPEQLEALQAQLCPVQLPAFSVQLGGLGFFDRAGALIVEVSLSRELASLQEDVTAATAHCGFRAEERPYHPHITLARMQNAQWSLVRHGVDAARCETPRLPGFVAREFCIYESFPGRESAQYEIRARFPLGL